MEGDWDFFGEKIWAAARTIAYYHQFPMWDPYRCGGTPLFADPFLPLLSPLAILRVIFQPMVGLRFEVPVYLAIGWAGGYFLGRVVGIGRLGAIACASIYPASSWFFLHFTIGHFNFMPFLYVPWLIALIWLARADRIIALSALGGMLATLIFFESGPTVAVFTAPLLAILVIWLVAARREPWPLLVAIGIALFAAGFSAIKLLPTLALVSSRLVGSPESDSISTLIHALFSRNQDSHIHLPGTFWGYYEYGAYVGVWFAALAAVGLMAWPRRALTWAFAAVALFAMSAGSFAWWAPWAMLHHLPPFSSEHVHPRFLIPFTLCLGVMAGFGADFIGRLMRPLGAIVAAAIILIGIVDARQVSVSNLYFDTHEVPSDLPPAAPFRQVWNESDHGMLTTIVGNLGAVNCCTPLTQPQFPTGSNQADYRGEQYLVGSGQISLIDWSPNRLVYQVSATDRARLVVNQNFDPGWRLREGTGDLAAFNGLLAVNIPRGEQRVVLVYRAPWFVVGAAISAVTLILAIALCWFELRGDGAALRSRPAADSPTDDLNPEDETEPRATAAR